MEAKEIDDLRAAESAPVSFPLSGSLARLPGSASSPLKFGNFNPVDANPSDSLVEMDSIGSRGPPLLAPVLQFGKSVPERERGQASVTRGFAA